MVFASRQDAGRQLGLRLRELALTVDSVAGLPRGGVVVAAEVAEILRCPLDVLVVRKIGHPWNREFAVGALAESDVLVLDEEAVASQPVPAADLEAVITEEKARLRTYSEKFHAQRESHFADARLLLVDDGLATGATAEAAIRSARKQGAAQVIFSVPVASPTGWYRVAHLADRIVTCRTDPAFGAVGQYYKQFLPTRDEEVLALLHHRKADYGQAA